MIKKLRNEPYAPKWEQEEKKIDSVRFLRNVGLSQKLQRIATQKTTLLTEVY
jgi:hypothetical protein